MCWREKKEVAEKDVSEKDIDQKSLCEKGILYTRVDLLLLLSHQTFNTYSK